MDNNNRKTEAQIDAEITALEAIKPSVRKMTFFNDDNHAAIDAQIRVLRERMDSRALHEAFGDPADGISDEGDLDDDAIDFDEHTLHCALEALDWMTGDSDAESPSEGWKDVK